LRPGSGSSSPSPSYARRLCVKPTGVREGGLVRKPKRGRDIWVEGQGCHRCPPSPRFALRRAAVGDLVRYQRGIQIRGGGASKGGLPRGGCKPKRNVIQRTG